MMAVQTETRKLAAVMFTDIEGYTSMFHSNESIAMDQIEQHRRTIEDITSRHNGQVIQYYGDGSLIIFDSVIDAVRSGIEIQKISQNQNLPVRVGIHMGDLVMKEGNIYGDVVNLASRIQAVGVPGSIVVSKKIIDELTNHPEINTIPLGHFELKNVKDPQEIFAIKGYGLSVPGKSHSATKKNYYSWLITAILLAIIGISGYFINTQSVRKMQKELRDEKIAVPPFENFTSDAEFNPVSQMAAHWITTELIELAEANVVSYPSSMFYSNTSEASMPMKTQFAKQTGAINFIKGSFSLTGQQKDSLVFWASIINTRSGEPLPIEFAKAYCDADDPLTCIRKLSNEIKGYWKSKNDKVLSPPNYDAYKSYLAARNTWDGINDSIPESYLREAIRLDPNFLDAYFLLLDLFYNRQNPQEATDTLKSMRNKFTDLTPRQENYMLYHEEDLKGRRVQAFRHFMKEYAIDPKDIFVNTSGMVMALTYLNDPERVLKFHGEIDIDSIDLNICSYCLERVMMVLQAYMMTGKMDKATLMAEKVKLHAVKRDDYHRLIEWYIVTGDTTSANQLLKKLSETNLDKDYRYLVFVAGRQAMLKGDTLLRNFYADLAIKLYAEKPSRALARAYYLKGDLENAKRIFDIVLAEDSTNTRIYGELGLIYAKQKNNKKANEMIAKMEALKSAFDYGETSYLQGRIKANLGEHSEAIRYLEKSLDEGQLFFNSVTFQGDPDLLVLKKDKNYQALLERNKQL
jgi:adenylate cyclase